MINVYGLKNCDTCRKACKWMVGENIPHVFFDLRADGVSRTQITTWATAVGWDVLLNKRSTTWRGLEDDVKAGVDEDLAITLMTTHPALIKRPVFEFSNKIVVGFNAELQSLLKS